MQSPASCTWDWLDRVWPHHYDLTYVSAMPGINSKGIYYPANTRFRHIIDVWDYGWSRQLGTTPPMAVTDTVKRLPKNPTRMVIHYAQPHQPFIGKTRLTYARNKPLRVTRFLPHPMLARWWWRLKRYLPIQRVTSQRLRDRYTQGVISDRQLRHAYADNLRLALQAVKALLPHLQGRTVITADHGELLGEAGELWHPCRLDHPLLRTVPWCDVNG